MVKGRAIYSQDCNETAHAFEQLIRLLGLEKMKKKKTVDEEGTGEWRHQCPPSSPIITCTHSTNCNWMTLAKILNSRTAQWLGHLASLLVSPAPYSPLISSNMWVEGLFFAACPWIPGALYTSAQYSSARDENSGCTSDNPGKILNQNIEVN